MVCDECGAKPATIHLTKVIGNTKTERHLCEECAREKGELDIVLSPHASIAGMLSGMFKNSPPLSQRTGDVCDVCGRSYEDFAKVGRLGCSSCYGKFESRLEPVLRRIHGGTEHSGKSPKRRFVGLSLRKQIDEKRRALEDAIKREAYEEAAVIRDQIRDMEKGLHQG